MISVPLALKPASLWHKRAVDNVMLELYTNLALKSLEIFDFKKTNCARSIPSLN